MNTATISFNHNIANEKRLTFDALRRANTARLPQFKNAQGEIAHSKEDGSDWTPADWMTAVVGELGEAANIMKKIKRGDFGNRGEDNAQYWDALGKLAKEFADVIIYMDLLAMQYGLTLDSAVANKFNETSRKVGADVFLSGGEAVQIPL
jgi:NTP pyrophosphatase (non-canonical NTP hydrolase)